MFSQGVPMLVAGDEIGRTQQGNNNAYCHDNRSRGWTGSAAAEELLSFVKRLTQLRREHPLFRRRTFFHGPVAHRRDEGHRMADSEAREITKMNGGWSRCAVWACSCRDAASSNATNGARRLRMMTWCCRSSAQDGQIDFHLPGPAPPTAWTALIDTARDDGANGPYQAGQPLSAAGQVAGAAALQRRNEAPARVTLRR